MIFNEFSLLTNVNFQGQLSIHEAYEEKFESFPQFSKGKIPWLRIMRKQVAKLSVVGMICR